MNRCNVDIFGYCRSIKPGRKRKSQSGYVDYTAIGPCDKDPKSCGEFITATELTKEASEKLLQLKEEKCKS